MQVRVYVPRAREPLPIPNENSGYAPLPSILYLVLSVRRGCFGCRFSLVIPVHDGYGECALGKRNFADADILVLMSAREVAAV